MTAVRAESDRTQVGQLEEAQDHSELRVLAVVRPELRVAVVRALGGEFPRCEVAGSVSEGLARARALWPELVIVDAALSGHELEALLDALRSERRTALLMLSDASPRDATDASGEAPTLHRRSVRWCSRSELMLSPEAAGGVALRDGLSALVAAEQAWRRDFLLPRAARPLSQTGMFPRALTGTQAGVTGEYQQVRVPRDLAYAANGGLAAPAALQSFLARRPSSVTLFGGAASAHWLSVVLSGIPEPRSPLVLCLEAAQSELYDQCAALGLEPRVLPSVDRPGEWPLPRESGLFVDPMAADPRFGESARQDWLMQLCRAADSREVFATVILEPPDGLDLDQVGWLAAHQPVLVLEPRYSLETAASQQVLDAVRCVIPVTPRDLVWAFGLIIARLDPETALRRGERLRPIAGAA